MKKYMISVLAPIVCGVGIFAYLLQRSDIFSRFATVLHSSREQAEITTTSLDNSKNPLKSPPPFALAKVTAESLPAVKTYNDAWTGIGPKNFGGKAFDVAVDPTNANVVYAAYGVGGLWKTNNGGATWLQLNDPSRNNHFASVHIWRKIPQVVFAGLGLPYQSINEEQGILKSADGGQTWRNLGLSLTGSYAVYRIEADPGNADVIFAATANAVYKTTNSGASWQKVLEYPNPDEWADMPDMVMHPTNPNVLYVAQPAIGIKMTTDGGATWLDRATGIIANGKPVLFAISLSHPNRLYAERMVDWSTIYVYRSDNAGLNWAQVSTLTDYHQSRYDMAMTVHPTNPDELMIANVFHYRSTNAGQTFAWVPHQAHVDHLRVTYAHSNPQIVYSANDGGIWKTADINDPNQRWQPADVGVQTNLSFSFGLDPKSDRIYLASGDYHGGFLYQGSILWQQFNRGTEWLHYYVEPHEARKLFYGVDEGKIVLYRTELGPNGEAIGAEKRINPDQVSSGYWRRVEFDPQQKGVVYVGPPTGYTNRRTMATRGRQ